MANRSKFIIRTTGTMKYYLVRGGQRRGGYTWKHGRPGRANAVRFNSCCEAQRLIDRIDAVAGGGQAEIVQVDA